MARKLSIAAPAVPSRDAADGRHRKPGRPRRDADPQATTLSRDAILERATELARAEPLEDLSIVRLARAFGVTPALIHYYVGSRDDLVSGVVNRYFEARVGRLAPPTGAWRADLEQFARTTYEQMLDYGGVVRYIAAHNRHRLFQRVGEGETDFGVEFFDYIGRIFRDGGFSPSQSALGYHLLVQFLVTVAHAEVARLVPGAHRDYIDERMRAIPRRRYPGAHHLAGALGRLDSATIFEAGLAVLLDGFAGWRRTPGRSSRGPLPRVAGQSGTTASP